MPYQQDFLILTFCPHSTKQRAKPGLPRTQRSSVQTAESWRHPSVLLSPLEETLLWRHLPFSGFHLLSLSVPHRGSLPKLRWASHGPAAVSDHPPCTYAERWPWPEHTGLLHSSPHSYNCPWIPLNQEITPLDQDWVIACRVLCRIPWNWQTEHQVEDSKKFMTM